MRGMILIAALLLALAGCNASAPEPEMWLRQAELSREERDALDLVGDDESMVYDYVVNDKIRSVRLQLFTLEDGGWRKLGGAAAALESQQGRFAVTGVGEKGEVRVTFQDAKGSSSWTSNSEIYRDTAGMNEARQCLVTTDLIAEEQQVLLMQSFGRGEMAAGADMDDFDSPERLTGFDVVNAVTVTFSKEMLS